MSSVAGKRSRMGIRSYKTAASKQNTAKVTGYNDAYIGKASFLKDIKYRNSGCSLRFAVIGVTGNIIFPENICVNVMLCLAVLRLNGIHEINCLIVSSYGSDITDKFRSFFDKGVRSRL